MAPDKILATTKLGVNISMENSTPQLTINDLATIRNIIDLAVTRGAFRANEVKTVGEIYERLDQFLTSLEQNMQESQDTEADQPSQGEES